MLDVLELVFVAVLVAGVALWSVPAAMVLAGVLGVVACERASAVRRRPVPRGDTDVRRHLRRVA